jgi:hypothetical protein
VTAPPAAEMVASPGDRAVGRSPADLAGDAPPLLTHVPRPGPGTTVTPLAGQRYGGLAAQQAEWDPTGGRVLLTARAPFADITGKAGFREDGSLDGTIELTARVAVLGLRVADCAWQVAGWQPEQPLPVPRVELRGSTLAVDLGTLPEGATCSAAEAVTSTRDGALVTATLPGDALPPGQPLSPRLQEAFRGLLGVDLGNLLVHRDADLGDAPAFVSRPDLFFAPGRYGADDPGTLRLLDQVIRAALAGLAGPVGALQPPPPVVPPKGEAAPAAGTTAVPANPAGPLPESPAPGAAASAGDRPVVPTAEGSDAAALVEAPAEGEPAEGPPLAGPPPPAPVQLLMPEAPTQLTPAATARGAAVARGARGAAHAARDLPSADQNVGDARGAVTEPAAETAARAQEALATELGERPPPSPEIVALCERIRTAIRENRPEDEDKLLKTDPTKEAQRAGATITGSVQGQADQVTGSYQAINSPPPGTPALTPTPVTAPAPSSPGMGAPAGQAAPDPIPPGNLSLDADVAATDQRIADSGIDTRVTREIPDGPFAQARSARGDLGQVAQTAPAELAAQQQQAIDSAQADMAQLQLQAVAAMQASRAATIGNVGDHQTGMVGHEQDTRDSVSRRAQGIFDTAQRAVDQLLQPLSRTAIARWEAGLTRLSQGFHDSLARVKAWIDDRHSGVDGAILAIGDYIGGLPAWVTDEYNRAEREFGDGVCDLLLSISSDVNGVIAAAQALIEGARRDIDAAFSAMEAEFPGWAAQERARFSGMLDGLGARVTQAQTGFVQDLSSRTVTAVNEAHAEVEAKRQEAGGLIGRVVAAIEEFIDDPIRGIINGLLRLVGIPPAQFWALIARIEQVIADIADDPEKFINNLVAGVRQGFEQFFDHFGTHVLHGFWDWLFSGPETPIPMPRDFSASSLFSFALQLMGITWPRVREILVRHIGPTAVEVIEAAWQLISVLIERGPDGIVELIKEQLTPENIVQTILEAAVQYLVETLIQQVVVRVVGLLNPVGAIAQAIDLIYQVCAWIFRNAARIFRFVEAVVNGMANVIAGNISGLATKVEQALASLIPPVIDFLAGLLHLGGLPHEVAEVITRLQAMVLAVMDRVIGFLAERGRALLRQMGLGGEEQPGHGDTELGTVVRFSAAGESHRLFVQREGSAAELMVASTPTTIPGWISRWQGKLAEGKPAQGTPERTEAEKLLGQLGPAAASADAAASALVKGFDAAERDPEHKTTPPDDSGVVAAERSIATMLDRLFKLFGENDQLENLQAIRKQLPQHGRTRTQDVVARWVADYLDPVKAKPIQGAESPVWDTQSFTADRFVPSEVLESNSNHMALLPYFEERNRTGGAESETFARWSLVRRASPVRAPFFRSLGNPFAAQLRTDGVAKLEGTGNSELLKRVRAIRYQASDANYGRFVPWPDSGVSVLVESTVFAGGGILPTLRAFAANNPVGGVTGPEFVAELGKSSETRQWASGQLRDAVPGQHEWIPVSLLYEVLSRYLLTTEGLKSASGWISLLETLRSPTDAVIFKLRVIPVTVIRAPGQVEERGLSQPTGHPGSLVYHPVTGRVSMGYSASPGRGGQVSLTRFGGLAEGTNHLHNALRAFFRQHAPSMTPAAWVDALLAYLPQILYTGDNPAPPESVWEEPIGVFVTLPSGVTVGGMKVRQFADFASERWAEIKIDFQQAKKGLPP